MSRGQWLLLALLVLSIFLNYLDRGTLPIAVPVIAMQFSLSQADVGSLSAAFFWTYALLQLFGISGWLADRFSPGVVLSVSLAIWSAATIACGLASGLFPLFAARLVLGAGESLAYPCYSRIFARDISGSNRGLANALLDAGSKLGPSLGALISGLMLARFGWRVFFVATGALSLLWLVPWLWMKPLWSHTSRMAKIPHDASPRILDILQKQSAWATFAGHFCGNYFWFFLLTWLPTYLITFRGFSIEKMATTTSLAYALMAAATVLAGWTSDLLIRRGFSATRVRKSIVAVGLLGCSIVLPVSVVENNTVSIVLLLLACVSFGVYTSNHWAITQTLAGSAAAGRWTSLQNGVGNLSGIAASWFTGIAVDRTQSFVFAFLAATLFALAGAVCWGLLVRKVEPVLWPSESAR